MAMRRYVTLRDFLKVRGHSRDQLAKQARVSEKTIDRWCNRADVRTQRTKMRRVGTVLGVDLDTVQHLLQNQQTALDEPASLKDLRYVLAILDHLTEVNLIGQSPAVMSQMLVRLQAVRSLVTKVIDHVDGFENLTNHCRECG